MDAYSGQLHENAPDVGNLTGNLSTIGEVLRGTLDRGKRERRPARDLLEESDEASTGEYRVRSPTRLERLNRALRELRPAAFKIHTLLWEWRGAPARGTLPFFTIRSLERFVGMTRPTIRKAMEELRRKGWITPMTYNKHHKNTLYRLVAIRKIPRPSKRR